MTRFASARMPAWSRVITTSARGDRKSTRLNSSHANISYAVFCLKKKKKNNGHIPPPRYLELLCQPRFLSPTGSYLTAATYDVRLSCSTHPPSMSSTTSSDVPRLH